VASLRAGDTLALGNSLPIRDADWFCRASTTGVSVWVQRGTNGIDGVLSGAAGAASVTSAPTTLLIGDIGFLHDVGGLWAVRQLRSPLTIVVLDNGGGRIFEQLPLAESNELPAGWFEHWTTPHSLDLEHAARLYAIPHATVTTAAELRTALGQARARAGATLIVAKVDPSSARRQRRRVIELLGTRLARES
jgi:2-succinyl-5-enolpyruvyl-6-hydroxy-3-cyclohexene-1-carboxylate synthase